jgi:poly-gamma-glutamate synthesis protein (capsule biosynthesis protein)
VLTWRKALLALAASFPVLAGAQWQPVLRNVPAIVSDRDGEHEQRPTASVKDGFTFAAGGDLLGPYSGRLLVEDPQIAPVAKIFQGADAGFANLEGNLFDSSVFTGYPAAENGGFEQGGVGSGPVLPKALATELKRAGITMLSTANNHSLDWGVDGMLATLANLDEAKIVHAGSGRSLLQLCERNFDLAANAAGRECEVDRTAKLVRNEVANDPDAVSKLR